VQCGLNLCPREINAKADSSGLGEQWLADRQDCHLSTTVLSNR
jgi:hypothetical protein